VTLDLMSLSGRNFARERQRSSAAAIDERPGL
jgi:hypothetical protein